MRQVGQRPSIQQSGGRGAYFESGEWANCSGWGECRGNTNATDLRHIAYQLAWYVYDNHSSRDQWVDLVGYSMGGLIVRWALYQIAAGNPLFPPVLYVRDAVTISTPHRGLDDGWGNVSWCPGGIQCSQMRPGSAFLDELNQFGLAPQGTGGTTWTAMGSRGCDIMTAEQATEMGDVHKIVFEGAKKKPGCYTHTGYLADTSAARDLPATYRNPGDAGWTSTATGAHALSWLADVLLGRLPTSSPSPPAPGGGGSDGSSGEENILQKLFKKEK